MDRPAKPIHGPTFVGAAAAAARSETEEEGGEERET